MTRRKRGRTIRSAEALRDLDRAAVLTREQYDTIWRLLDGGARAVVLDVGYNVLEVK